MPQTKPFSDQDVSALMDEASVGPDASLALDRLLAAQDAQASWHRYHLIGDMIRSDSLPPCAANLGFAQRVLDSLETEISLQTLEARSDLASPYVVPQKVPSTNLSQFQMRALATVFGFCVLTVLKVSLEVALDQERPVMTRNPELDALLSAHQEMGGHSALQTPSGFLRNATFDRSKR